MNDYTKATRTMRVILSLVLGFALGAVVAFGFGVFVSQATAHDAIIYCPRDGRAGADCTGHLHSDLMIGVNKGETIRGVGGVDEIHGRLGPDRIAGHSGGNQDFRGDHLYGGDGTDNINGGNDYDYIEGNQRNDIINGGFGWDELFGNLGADDIYGGPHDDDLNGNQNNDYLDGGAEWDVCDGGRGDRDVVFRCEVVFWD